MELSKAIYAFAIRNHVQYWISISRIRFAEESSDNLFCLQKLLYKKNHNSFPQLCNFSCILFVANFFLKSTFSKKLKNYFNCFHYCVIFMLFVVCYFFFFFLFQNQLFRKNISNCFTRTLTFSLLVNFSYFFVVHFFSKSTFSKNISNCFRTRTLTLSLLCYFSCYFVVCYYFSKPTFFRKKYFRNCNHQCQFCWA